MTTMYRTDKYYDKIVVVEVVKRTAKQIVRRVTGWNGETYERRESIENGWHKYHDTEEDALRYLIERANEREKAAKQEAERWHSRGEILQAELAKLEATK